MRLSMDDLSGNGLACMEASVRLSVVVVPTSRLVHILCVLSCIFFMSMRRFNPYSWLVVWPWSVCYVAQSVMFRWSGEPCSTVYVLLGYCLLLLLL